MNVDYTRSGRWSRWAGTGIPVPHLNHSVSFQNPGIVLDRSNNDLRAPHLGAEPADQVRVSDRRVVDVQLRDLAGGDRAAVDAVDVDVDVGRLGLVQHRQV